ncbi:LXG domain-containing protein [Terribacillus saccharophilus]|uniref:LXG domain-containing protein n=1 Tax=Terribacillus saccharophilus TaxID=361277 RepID=UPI000C9BB8C4|nr:LXG domain-containing protein [Terribacillus goriensis]
MKELAVKEIHKGTETSKLDLDTLSEQLSNLQQKVRNLYSLDDALKGKTGKAIRSYYNEIHTPFLTFLLQSMEDYKNRLDNMKNDVQSFEPSHQGYISEGFLDNELHPGLDKAKSKVASVSDNINQVLSSVADIRFVAQVSYSDFETYIEKGKRQIDEVITDLGELDSKHASHLQETQSDLDTMKKYLSEMTIGLSSGAISISDFDAVSLQDMNAYNNVIQQSYGNGNIEITEDNIEYLPMAAIAAATKNAEKGMDEGTRGILQHAYVSLEQGEISKKKYNAILFTASKINGHDQEKAETFIDYTNKNWDKIVQDVSKEALSNSIEQLGIQIEKVGLLGREMLEHNVALGIVGSRTARSKTISSNNLIKHGDKIISSGKFLGKAGIPLITGGYGMYEDMTKKDKTFGESFAHNAASYGAGALASAGTAFLISNPGGWAILGTVAVGVVASHGFNYLYDNNVLGIQDGLDAVGNKIDNAWNATVDHVDKTVDSFKEIGEGIKGSIESLNPMNWRWSN